MNLGIGPLMNSGSLHLSDLGRKDMLVSMKNVLGARVKMIDFYQISTLVCMSF